MFLDIAVAVFSASFVSYAFDFPHSFLFVAVSILFSLLPDVDIVSPYFVKVFTGKKTYNHRTFLHYPIVHVGVGILISLISFPYGVLYLVNTFLHFVHDTFFLGWGVVWLWPFKETRFKCFPDRDGKITGIPLVTWEPKEDRALMERYDDPEWIRNFYLRPNIVAYVEYGAFLASIIFIHIS